MPVNGFGVYITDYSTNRTVELPVNPSELTLKYETDDRSETIVNLGEINRVGNMKLVSVSIDSIFPKKRSSWVSSDKLLKPDEYINWLKNIQSNKHHVQLVVSSTQISVTMTISSFEYGFKSGYADEYAYTLGLKQYREVKYHKVNVPAPPKPKPRPAPPKKLGIGSIVIVNGRLRLDSYGSAPGVYENNVRRRITYLAPGHPFPIHVALVNGGPRGWVRQSEVRLA